MRRPFPKRRSVRESLIASKTVLDFMADAVGQPRMQIEIPPKRERIRRPVDGKPAGPSEHQVQSAVISWWWRVHRMYGLPHFALFAIPNGGARDEITGARLKAEGVRRGVYDLMLAKPTSKYHGLFIEMKVGDKQPSDDQRAFGEYLGNAGYKQAVHWSTEAAIAEIENYLGQAV